MSLIETVRVQISSAAYVPVTLPAGVTTIRSFSLHTEDSEDYWLSGQADGTNGVLMPGGLPIAPTLHKPLVFGTGTVVLGYVKGTTSTYVGGIIIP